VQRFSKPLYGLMFGPTGQDLCEGNYRERANGKSMTTLITPGSASGSS
jgi:hypothetical protein